MMIIKPGLFFGLGKDVIVDYVEVISPDEKVSISSVQKFWKFLINILKNIPERSV